VIEMLFARPWVFTFALAVTACSSRDATDKPKPSAVAQPTAPAAPARDDRFESTSLGALTFAHSEGTPKARELFARGLLALHSFWYDEAARQFAAAIAADPTMNMAYWGAGMSHLKLLWGEDDLDAARQIMSRMPNPDLLTPREQAWLMAAVELVRAGDIRTSRTRFAAALEALHAQYPDDESATFLAVALLATTRPEDPDTVAVRKRAAALAIEVFTRNPKHPGAAHYLIHAYDTPELAALALPFAREYAKIAPAAFHARHMPAHIFSRLGMWKDAIVSCQSAWDASVAAARHDRLTADHHDFHSLTWIIEMNFELGRRADADAALNVFSTAVRGGLNRQQRALYAHQVSSYLMRTGEWTRIDELLAPLQAAAAPDLHPAPPPPIAGRAGEAKSHCAPTPATAPLEMLEQLSVLEARARAAAMQRELVKTKGFIAEIEALRVRLRPFFETTQPKDLIARIDVVHSRRHEALLARAAGNDRALLAVLRTSATDAGSDTGGESNPSGFVVREELADTLMRLGQADAARVEYAAVLQQHPGRAHSVLGAARSAERGGDRNAARKSYEQLLALWSAADDGTDGLAEARAALTTKN